MGLFGWGKKRLSKEEEKTLEKAREHLRLEKERRENTEPPKNIGCAIKTNEHRQNKEQSKPIQKEKELKKNEELQIKNKNEDVENKLNVTDKNYLEKFSESLSLIDKEQYDLALKIILEVESRARYFKPSNIDLIELKLIIPVLYAKLNKDQLALTYIFNYCNSFNHYTIEEKMKIKNYILNEKSFEKYHRNKDFQNSVHILKSLIPSDILENISKSEKNTSEIPKKSNKDKIQELYSQIKKIEREEELQAEQEKFNEYAHGLNGKKPINDSKHEYHQTGCSVDSCNTKVGFFSGKKCKFCHNQYCFEHIQMEKHDCIKTTPTKYLRKTWLRRYDLNISSGRYIVVCDECHYVSDYGSLIDIAGNERKNHIESKGCEPKQVFLEEDLVDEKIPENIDLEQSVPTDRVLRVCSNCRPPQKFTERSEYIEHHSQVH